MNTVQTNSWQEQAEVLAREGISWRKIAKTLGKGKSTVSDHLRKVFKSDVHPTKEKSGPRILFLDIETFAMTLSGWGLFNQNFSIEQIEQDWSILSFCAKFAGGEEIYYQAIDEYSEKEMLQTLWDLMDEADYVCGHNARKFDVKKIFSRMIVNGFDRPRPFRIIDTLEVSKRCFGMSSNKLAYLTQLLCKEYVKSDHGKFSGFSLWKECAKGNPEAFEELKKYNILDVLSLEELYTVLQRWDTKLPVFSVHSEIIDNSDWESCGFVYSNLGKYECYRNKKTGQYRRSRRNLLTKEQRDNLLANIV